VAAAVQPVQDGAWGGGATGEGGDGSEDAGGYYAKVDGTGGVSGDDTEGGDDLRNGIDTEYACKFVLSC
jgi:hypothetical protein